MKDKKNIDGHTPVLLKEAIDALDVKKDGFYIDGTFGRGGHSKEILERLGEKGRLVAIDRDPDAISDSEKLFEGDIRFNLDKDEMKNIKLVSQKNYDSSKIHGILLDLGVSSPQLDCASRGFSFQKDGPLDMRMDPINGLSAADWLARVSEKKLREVLFKYGEERFSSRIARSIIKSRSEKPILTTLELAEIIKNVYPNTHQKKHPATKTFQAIRIFINDELKQLENALDSSLEILKKGGRLCVISFHSLEDRIVKRFIRNFSNESEQYRGMPDVPDEFKPKLKKIGKAIKASVDEVKDNVRSRSAVLRIAERI